MRTFSSLIFISTVLISGSLFAQTKSWTQSASTGSFTSKSLIPEMSTEESYTQRYSFSADLDGGGNVGVDFTISNLGWGDGNGGVELRVKLPGQTKYKFQKKKDDDEWTYSKNNFKLNIAGTTIKAAGKNKFQLIHKSGKASLNLVFTNHIPKWRPGKGQVTVDGDKYYKYGIIAPRADVEGTITIGGKTLQVKSTGKGFADYVATNIAPYDLATRFSRFRDFNGDLFVAWREIRLTEDKGGKSLVWVVLGYKDKIVFSDANARMKEGKIKSDGKTGYRIPYAVQIDGKKGGDKIRLILRGKSVKRKDMLKSMGSPVKSIASLVAKPFSFNFGGEYTLQMNIGGTKATLKGKSNYTLDYINK